MVFIVKTPHTLNASQGAGPSAALYSPLKHCLSEPFISHRPDYARRDQREDFPATMKAMVSSPTIPLFFTLMLSVTPTPLVRDRLLFFSLFLFKFFFIF